MELQCGIQNYDWGKKGADSTVANLVKSRNQEYEIDENKPYAELWMGTHVNAPSVIKNSSETLSAFIEKHPETLGEPVINRFGTDLPFLFKVLSVSNALSIQAHPNKKHAEELHEKFPDIYKDPNHKPEMAIALTPFEALCGFRPIDEIKAFMQDIPELGKIVNWEELKKFSDDDILTTGFKRVLNCDKQKIALELQNLLRRCHCLDDPELAQLFERLYSQFPNDAGIFMIFFLNYLQLNPSDAIYLGANEPHAYLSGDCVECMACSDNVVRAGLTPKFVDVDTLCSMLIYKGEKPEEKLFRAIEEDKHSRIFRPPVPDFGIAEIKVPASVKSYSTIKRNSGSILLVIKGQGKSVNCDLSRGTVLFLPANDILDINEITDDLVMYQALANV